MYEDNVHVCACTNCSELTSFQPFHLFGALGVSAPALHRVPTYSLIEGKVSVGHVYTVIFCQVYLRKKVL